MPHLDQLAGAHRSTTRSIQREYCWARRLCERAAFLLRTARRSSTLRRAEDLLPRPLISSVECLVVKCAEPGGLASGALQALRSADPTHFIRVLCVVIGTRKLAAQLNRVAAGLHIVWIETAMNRVST